ncbi:cytochrome P450 [Parvularcula sp. LCG005]|uniref:cytochrome P450 n=1 Tax=Parvularcula sp. LCG005 TaxID=3078805 RepID=UPI00294269A7|nr:cytochrome P450 [Parvularcula sp. LCG005]WOI54390.1 cytochrome P450 [Parvularcula sp. LCG005]
MTASASVPLKPRTVPPMPSGTGPIRRLRASLKNPVSMYTEDYFRDPIIKARMGGRWFAQVMDPDLVQKLLQGEGTFCGRSPLAQKVLKPALRDGLLTAEGQTWKTQRKAASPAFRARALASLVPTFSRAGLASRDRLLAQRGETVNIALETTRATFDVISDVLLAQPGEGFRQEDVAENIAIFAHSIGRFTLYDLFPVFDSFLPRRLFSPGYKKGMAAVAELRAMATDIVERRMAVPLAEGAEQDDLMGLLIAARDPETGAGLNAEELVDNALTFVGAGHETTAVALAWTLSILAQSPHWQDALAEEATSVLGDRAPTAEDLPRLALHDRVVREAMRLYPPVAIIPRGITAPVELGGHHFGPGDHVSVGVYPMHRHQALWVDPWAFDPDRFLPERASDYHKYQWLPFGGGPRVCIGLRFAMMEAVAILATLTPSLRFSMPGAQPPEPYLAVTMRPRGGVPLKIEAR